jgi:hypothetical protein
MKWLLAFILIPSISFAALSPDTVAKAKLTDSDWLYVAQKVSEGDQSWLNTVPDLAPKANRGQANELEEALAAALPINTKGVLAILHVLDAGSYPEMMGTVRVCVLKVVNPGKSAEDYYHNTRLALLDEPNGAECLWNLEGIREEVKRK